MAPQRAVSFITGLELPGDEAYCIIECDVRESPASRWPTGFSRRRNT